MPTTDKHATPDASWRGASHRSAAAPRFGWNSVDAATRHSGGARQPRGGRWRVGLWSVVGVALVAWLVAMLIDHPHQTPFIAVVATDYDLPLPPQAWAAEDLDRLARLDGQTIRLSDTSPLWTSQERGLQTLEHQLAECARHVGQQPAVVLYVSMPGVVDAQGLPALIPPGGNPLVAETFLPLAELLARIKRAPLAESCLKLLVLDCQRTQVQWSAGIVYNTFGERLAEVVEQAAIPNLVVVSAAGPGEPTGVSSAWQASIFGYYFARGLAGDADVSTHGGNGDHAVSLVELRRYVDGHVSAWMQQQRGLRQRPLWIPRQLPNRTLAWSHRGAGRAVSDDAPGTPNSGVLPPQLDALWQQHDELLAQQPERLDAMALAHVQQRLVHLEQLATAGRAYHAAAQASLADLQRTLARLAAPEPNRLDHQPLPTQPLRQRFGNSSSPRPTVETVWQAQLERESAWFVERPELWQLARTTIERGEQVAAPRDERCLRWLRDSLSPIDTRRRQAEDTLWLGTAAAFDESRQHFQAALDAYAQLDTFSHDVGAQLATLDRIAAEFPATLAWWSRPLPQLHATAEHDSAVQQLLAVLADLQRAPQAATSAEVMQLAQSVASRYQPLRARLLAHAESLTARSQTSPTTLAEIDALLATPLLPARQRSELRTLRWELESHVDGDGRASGGGNASVTELDDSASLSQRYLERVLVRTSRHPALALCEAQAPSTASPTTETPANTALDRLAAQANQRLREALTRSRSTSSTLEQAEWHTRLTAALRVAPLEPDPLVERRQRDLRNMLLLAAARTLDDFRGPAEQGQPSFFVTATHDLLQAVERLGTCDTEQTALVAALRAKLVERRRLAEQGVSIAAADMVVVDEVQEANSTLTVTRTAAEAPFPVGTLTLALRDEQGRLPHTSRAVALDQVATQSVELTLRDTPLAQRGPQLTAIAYFRGHEFTAPCQLRPSGGARVETTTPEPRPTTITLAGPTRRRPSVLFILDCSHSMREPVEVEEPGTSGKLSRLDVAKSALVGMLRRLAERGDARVGIRAYGHRVGWSTDRPGEMLRQTAYAREIPDTLRPSDDVELMLPLGRFDDTMLGGVETLLATVQPWGETPLYRALVDALGDFAADAPQTEQSIVVVTDGLNYQYNAPHPTTRDDVLIAAGDRRVPIHIVGFGIPRSDTDAARREFGQLAEQTRGTYTPATHATSLIRTLESLLGHGQYTVQDATGQIVTRGDVGRTLTLPAGTNLLRPVTVHYAEYRMPLRLHGGEAVELLVNREARRIETPPYLVGAPRWVPLTNGPRGENSAWQLGVHRPVREGRRVAFNVSVQSLDKSFTSRPNLLWAELTPLDERGAPLGPKYIGYDESFQPERPTPVATWTAVDWPVRATRAAVQVWCRREALSGSEQSIAPWLEAGASATRRAVPDLPGITYQVRVDRVAGEPQQRRLAVIERHTTDSPGIDALRVALHPAPLAAQHRFDPAQGIVTHLFTLRATDDRDVAAYRLHFSARAELLSGALHMAEPLNVSVYELSDVLQP